MAILQEMAVLGRRRGSSSSQARRRPLSNMAMEMLLRRMKVDVTVHGFRSSFRDWAAEETPFAREIAEAALAHVVGDATERAYRRGDALERRRELMQAWGTTLLSCKRRPDSSPLSGGTATRRWKTTLRLDGAEDYKHLLEL
jgi:hypothetical protein